MKLTILGSGTMVPTKTRNPSSYLLQLGKKYMLLDCGHGTLQRLVDINFHFEKIDYICISHFHTDHFSGLMPLIHAIFVQGMFDSKKGRKKPLTIIGPKNIKKAYTTIKNIMWSEKNEWKYVPIIFKEAKNNTFRFNKFYIKTLSVFHTKILNAISYKIISKNKTLVYSGDLNSKMDKNAFAKFSKEADTLIIDTARPIGWRGGHLEPIEVGKIAKDAQVKHLFPTHLKDIDSSSKIIKKIRKNYQGKITIAKDFTKIDI